MSQKIPLNDFEQTEDISKFDEGFIKKTIMKKMMNDI